jgi:hypothetical protein
MMMDQFMATSKCIGPTCYVSHGGARGAQTQKAKRAMRKV